MNVDDDLLFQKRVVCTILDMYNVNTLSPNTEAFDSYDFMSAFFSNTNDTNDYACTRLEQFFLTYVCKLCTNFDKLCTR